MAPPTRQGAVWACLLVCAALSYVPLALAAAPSVGSVPHSNARSLKTAGQQQPSSSAYRVYRYIVVTPAGRKSQLALLYNGLLKQKASFDEWHLWANTKTPEDRAYIEGLAAQHPWVVLKEKLPHDNAVSQGMHDPLTNFFQHCQDPRAIYLRIDDDVVWMEPKFVKRMFHYRVMHPEPFIIFANIINNAVIDHIHQRLGNLPLDLGMAGYNCLDELGWRNGTFAEFVHRTFIRSVREGNLHRWHFRRWILAEYEHVSVNAHTFRGADFAEFKGFLVGWEERALAIHKPKELQRPNVIYGGAVCVHLAFYTQRPYLDANAPDLLNQYAELEAVEATD